MNSGIFVNAEDAVKQIDDVKYGLEISSNNLSSKLLICSLTMGDEYIIKLFKAEKSGVIISGGLIEGFGSNEWTKSRIKSAVLSNRSFKKFSSQLRAKIEKIVLARLIINGGYCGLNDWMKRSYKFEERPGSNINCGYEVMIFEMIHRDVSLVLKLKHGSPACEIINGNANDKNSKIGSGGSLFGLVQIAMIE